MKDTFVRQILRMIPFSYALTDNKMREVNNLENLIQSVDWKFIDQHSNAIFLIEENSCIEITEEFKKEEMLLTNSFVRYNVNQYNSFGSVSYYKIVEKVLSPKENLLIFAERTSRQF